MTAASIPSWAECHAAGMTASAAARARGTTIAAACMWASRHEKAWRPVTPEERSASKRRIGAKEAAAFRWTRTLNKVLSADEMRDYRACRKAGLPPPEAMTTIRRTDLVGAYRRAVAR